VGKRSVISQLPPDERQRLEQVLIANGFSNYRGIAEEMTDRGYPVGKSALQRYGKTFEERLATLKLSHDFAIAYKQALPDEAGARAEVLTDLAQDTLFNLVLQLQNRANQLSDEAEDEELTNLSTLLSRVTKAIADVNRSGVTVKRYANEIRAKQEAKFKELEIDAEKGGIDLEFLQRVKTEVLRIC
jgi:Protein of unknown function (DUF3486)